MFARMSSQHPLHLHASGLSCRFNRSPQRGHRARIRDCLLIAEAAIPARKHELSGGNDRSRRHPTFVKIEATSRQRTKPDPRRCTTIRCAQCSIDNSDAPRHGASSRKRPFTTTRILYIASSGCQSLPGRAFKECPRGGGCCRRTFRRFPRSKAVFTRGAAVFVAERQPSAGDEHAGTGRPRSQSTGRRDLFPATASDHLPGSGQPERQNHRKRRGLRL